jgi:hypothetical protein
MRRIATLAAVLLLALSTAAAAQTTGTGVTTRATGTGAATQATGTGAPDALYAAQTIITGQDNLPERERGFREALAEVILRLTADPAAPASPAGRSLLSEPTRYVAAFELEDRKKGIQISDEQGSRDRSFFLRVRFDRDRLKPAMEAAGLTVWEAPRPPVTVALGIDDGIRRYVLTDGSERGYGQRETLRSLAARRVAPLVLPGEPPPVSYDDLSPAEPARLPDLRRRLGAELLLAGSLVMDEGGRWTLKWAVDPPAGPAATGVERGSFDAALRAAMDGALAQARALSPQGAAPRSPRP